MGKKCSKNTVDANCGCAVDSQSSARLCDTSDRLPLARWSKSDLIAASADYVPTSREKTRGLDVPAITSKVRSDTEVNLHLLYAATKRRLECYSDLVRENRQVPEALEFARYVLNSGMVQVLAAHDTPADLAPGGLKIDSALLRWTANDLATACTERFRLNDSKPHLEALQLQSINQKLDTLAGYLGKLVGSGQPDSLPTSPELKVLQGGLKEEVGG